MKKRNGIIIFVCALLVVVTVVLVMNRNNDDYSSAYEKTNKLDSFEMTLDTIITIDDGTNTLERITQQTLKAQGRKKGGLIYEITTIASMSNSETESFASEETSMVYCDGVAYQNLSGLKYSANVTKEIGEENLENFINTIAFSLNEIENVEEKQENGGTLYTYTVDFEHVSDNVKNSLQEAINEVGGNFKPGSMTATAFVKDGYVKERSFYVIYTNEDMVVVSVELFEELIKTSASVEKPNKNEYPVM